MDNAPRLDGARNVTPAVGSYQLPTTRALCRLLLPLIPRTYVGVIPDAVTPSIAVLVASVRPTTA